MGCAVIPWVKTASFAFGLREKTTAIAAPGEGTGFPTTAAVQFAGSNMALVSPLAHAIPWVSKTSRTCCPLAVSAMLPRIGRWA